jgi:hypothetical protein
MSQYLRERTPQFGRANPFGDGSGGAMKTDLPLPKKYPEKSPGDVAGKASESPLVRMTTPAFADGTKKIDALKPGFAPLWKTRCAPPTLPVNQPSA